MTLDAVKRSLGIKEKLALWILWRWFKEEFMFGSLTGWKTKAGGLALLFAGVGGVLMHVSQALGAVSEGNWSLAWWYMSNEAMQVAVASAGTGLAALGIGHKVQKAQAAMTQATVAAVAISAQDQADKTTAPLTVNQLTAAVEQNMTPVPKP